MFLQIPLGEGNLNFSSLGSQENFYGSVNWQNNYNNFKFKVGIFKNKSIDHRDKEICAIIIST